ncbi:MAG: UDPGP type 1 family protein [Lachnospiraceae bacterium]|jgi:UDP-N-acetylglucosamine/UDP-N-acetylgalactosamine diphosphorylase|nr:UDPGP type 1 family protein [Lachnospiraceae bacterium]
MTYQEAYQKLEKAGQLHVLAHYESLTEAQQKSLLKEIGLTDFSVLSYLEKREELMKKGEITPLAAMEISEIERSHVWYEELGYRAIRQGQVGTVLLAGGMGTRLGSDEPKGMYDIGLTKPVYIFERIISNLLEVVERACAWIHLFIMTSDKNHEKTVAFLAEHDYFGYEPGYIHFFRQEMAPASDFNGKVYMERPDKIANSPNGNGGWFSSMANGGILEIVKNNGIEWLNVFAVDNVLQRMADPCFVGAVIARGCSSGAKVVKKNAPDEKVGVMCLEDGRPSIVEYYDLTDELMHAKNEKGEPAYNFGAILNYLFQVKALEKTISEKLPLHIVEKKIPYMDDDGNFVKPEEANGYKYETLVLDMVHMMDSCLPYEVEREREFAPIKNMTGIDSVDTARELCRKNGIVL